MRTAVLQGLGACQQAEHDTNPYLRCGDSTLRTLAGRAARARGPAAVLGALRTRKDRWGTEATLTSAVLAAARWLPPLARRLGVDP